MNIAFFGTPDLALPVLDTLVTNDYRPSLVVTAPDRPAGRKQILTPSPVKVWATAQQIPVWQPESLKDISDSPLHSSDWDLFVVFAYGNILPSEIINLPKYGTVNLHPSLLPNLRGPSPIRSAILTDQRTTGITIMLMDEKMDHGPILSQEVVTIPEEQWPLAGPELDVRLIKTGAELLVHTLPRYITNEIEPQEQDHERATYCTKITKSMGELSIDPRALPSGAAAYKALLKIRAFSDWPGTFFFYNNKRVKIIEADISDQEILQIHTVLPEGKNAVPLDRFLNNFSS